jgi:hypothetical protein
MKPSLASILMALSDCLDELLDQMAFRDAIRGLQPGGHFGSGGNRHLRSLPDLAGYRRQ